MSSQEDRVSAGRAVFVKWLSDEVRAVTAIAREALEPNMEAGERLRAELPDGTPIGTVTIGKAAETASVTDARALLAWVKEHRPTEIVESVNLAYVDQLRREAKVHGHAFDKETGEIIPGIEVVTGSTSYRPTVDATSIPVLRARLAEVIAGGLLEITSAPQERAS